MIEGLYIGRVARAAAVDVQTVRYYERLGLLPAAERAPSGYRVYSSSAVERLRFIRQAQGLGFRLEEIREILRIKYTGQAPCKCVRDTLQRKLEEVEEQMADLARFRKRLKATLKQAQRLPHLSHRATAICPLIENLPAANRKGGEKR